MDLKPGTALQNGKYLFSQALGDEGFGVTYRATQTFLNQAVVIKTLDPSLQVTRSFPQLHQRFVEETRLLARSQHPSLVRVLDFFQEENLPFLVMDYVPGQTLTERVKSQGALPEAEAVHYLQQIGSAIDTAHQNGLIHRNLSPDSIIRRPGTNLAVLVGFGIAHEVSRAVSPLQANLFADQFAPPDERWSADDRFAIDLYGLSAILYYLLSARAPGVSPQLDLEPWNPALKQAILRGMSSDLTRRPSTIAAWLRLLPSEAVPLRSVTAAVAPPLSQPIQKELAIAEPISSPTHSSAAKQVSPPLDPSLPILPKPELAQPTLSEGDDRCVVTPLAIAPAIHQTHPVQKSLPAPQSMSAFSRHKLAFTSLIIPLEISKYLPKFVGLTSAAAVSIGVGFGLALRFSAAQAPGASFFHPDQSFPSKDWKGMLTPPGDVSDVPIEKPGITPSASRNRLASPQNNPSAATFSDDAPPKGISSEELIAPPIRSEAPQQSTAAKSVPIAPAPKPAPIPSAPARVSPSLPTSDSAPITDPAPPAKPSSGTNRKSIGVPTLKGDPKL